MSSNYLLQYELCLNLVHTTLDYLHFQLDITEEDCFSLFPLETLVYLTPDSEHGMYFTA